MISESFYITSGVMMILSVSPGFVLDITKTSNLWQKPIILKAARFLINFLNVTDRSSSQDLACGSV